ncbi:hypothetical protein ACQ4PT_026111 [Festuca glaucescens]
MAPMLLAAGRASLPCLQLKDHRRFGAPPPGCRVEQPATREVPTSKIALKMAMARMKLLLQNKKEAQLRQMRREVAQLLDGNQNQTARWRSAIDVKKWSILADDPGTASCWSSGALGRS